MPQQPIQQPKAQKGSKISNTEWGLLIGALMWIDLIQFFLDAFAIGALINRFIDIVVGMSLGFYFWLRGVKMDTKKVMSLIASFALEEVPAIDALPLWSADGIATMLWDKADKNLPDLPI